MGRIQLAFNRMCHSVESDTASSVKVDLALRGVTVQDFRDISASERDQLIHEFGRWVERWQSRRRI